MPQLTLPPGKQWRLFPTHTDIFRVLYTAQGQIVSMPDLVKYVWGSAAKARTRHTLCVRVGELREKLCGSGYEIETVVGKGYRLAVRDGTE